jgi:hypothetical protein
MSVDALLALSLAGALALLWAWPAGLRVRWLPHHIAAEWRAWRLERAARRAGRQLDRQIRAKLRSRIGRHLY